MSTFGNFARPEQVTTDKASGLVPGDIGLAEKPSASTWAEQIWSLSPANFQTQSSQARTADLPASGYGRGERARLDNAILQNLGDVREQQATGPIEAIAVYTPPQPTEGRPQSLRSLLPPGPHSRRLTDAAEQPAATNAAASARPLDLIEALSMGAPAPAPLRFDTALALQPLTQEASVKPAPLDLQARPAADVKSHPLFANLSATKLDAGANFNARMENPQAIESLSRQFMAASFKAPQGAGDAGPNGGGKDPFLADNCYQSMEFSPDGMIKTTTTLPDLSASKIECHLGGKLSSLALNDHLGRPTVQQRFDLATGQLIAQTTSRFDHTDVPMQPSYQLLQTETQTIEKRFDDAGKVTASKVMPSSDLSSVRSLA